MIEYNYEDYIFLSSRINALSASLIGNERLEDMLRARTLSEFYRMLEDSGVKAEKNRYGELDLDGAVNRRFTDLFLSVLNDVPQKQLFSVFTYPYDCHNLKAAIKCAEKGIKAEELLLPLGSVPSEKIQECVLSGNFSVFPQNMANAAEEARSVYARTRDPQAIDLVIDRACFADMKETAEENPVGFFKEALRAKADQVNILTALRLIRMPSVQTDELMRRAYVCGGSLGEEFFSDILTQESEDREQVLAEKLIYSGFDKLGHAMSGVHIELSEAERICNESYIAALEAAGEALAGAETVAVYLARLETEARNLRILLAGKKAGYGEKELSVRLRQ